LPKDRIKHRRFRHRGAAALEAAIVLPILGLVAVGCIDLGRLIHAQNALTNAVRIGAEFGATHRVSPDDRARWEQRIRDAVAEEAANVDGFASDSLEVQIEVVSSGPDDVRVTVEAVAPIRLLLPWPGFPTSLSLRHAVTMRQYQ
jgi:Flp pilus assembly protein TadG